PPGPTTFAASLPAIAGSSSVRSAPAIYLTDRTAQRRRRRQRRTTTNSAPTTGARRFTIDPPATSSRSIASGVRRGAPAGGRPVMLRSVTTRTRVLSPSPVSVVVTVAPAVPLPRASLPLASSTAVCADASLLTNFASPL